MSDPATGSHKHSVTITGGQSATGSFTLPTEPLAVTIEIPPHKHPLTIPAKVIKIGGKLPNGDPNPNVGPSIKIPGDVDIQLTGDAYMLIWRDGRFKGKFPEDTEIAFDPTTVLVEKTIVVLEDPGEASSADYSSENNTQLIPPLL